MSTDNTPKKPRIINQNHLMFLYFKLIFPLWDGDITASAKISNLLGHELMQIITSDMADVTKECVDDETKNESKLITSKALAFRNANSEKLKQIQSQI